MASSNLPQRKQKQNVTKPEELTLETLRKLISSKYGRFPPYKLANPESTVVAVYMFNHEQDMQLLHFQSFLIRTLAAFDHSRLQFQ